MNRSPANPKRRIEGIEPGCTQGQAMDGRVLSTSGDLIGNLEDQLKLFGRLDRLSEQQTKLVSAADTRPLVLLIAERHRITRELTGLTGALAQRLPASDSDGLSSADRNRANKMLASIREHLKRLIQRDAEDARILAARKDQTRAGISAVHSSQRAMVAYGQTSSAKIPNPTRMSREA